MQVRQVLVLRDARLVKSFVVTMDMDPESIPIFSRLVAYGTPHGANEGVYVPDVDPEAACTRE